jgi:hypothetical protein
MRLKNHSGVALATAAAMLFGSAVVSTAIAGEADKVECMGVNGCKGHSDCKTASNNCKGMNSCKGQGFLDMTKKECEAAQAKMKEGKK